MLFTDGRPRLLLKANTAPCQQEPHFCPNYLIWHVSLLQQHLHSQALSLSALLAQASLYSDFLLTVTHYRAWSPSLTQQSWGVIEMPETCTMESSQHLLQLHSTLQLQCLMLVRSRFYLTAKKCSQVQWTVLRKWLIRLKTECLLIVVSECPGWNLPSKHRVGEMGLSTF